MLYLVIFMASAIAGGLFSFTMKKWKEKKQTEFYKREIYTLDSVVQLEVGRISKDLSTNYPHPLSSPATHEQIDTLLAYLEQENRVNFSKLHYTYNRLRQAQFLSEKTPK